MWTASSERANKQREAAITIRLLRLMLRKAVQCNKKRITLQEYYHKIIFPRREEGGGQAAPPVITLLWVVKQRLSVGERIINVLSHRSLTGPFEDKLPGFVKQPKISCPYQNVSTFLKSWDNKQ